jgi:hypothetical protein
MKHTMTEALATIERNVQQQELLDDFNAIQMARTPEVLKRFVVGAQAIDHPAQGWAQCVLELQIKYDDIRRAKINAELIQMEIEELEAENTPKSLLNAKLKRIDLEAQDRAMLGAIREFQSLYAIYKNYGKRYSRRTGCVTGGILAEPLDATSVTGTAVAPIGDRPRQSGSVA